MVQKSPILVSFFQIISRVILLIGIILLSTLFLDPLHDLILGPLQYQIPPGFFMDSWADWSLAWALTSVLLSGVIFGTLGKKIDYFFIAIGIGVAVWEFTGTENVNLNLYLSLLGIIIVGNLVGFGLKNLRQRFFKKSWLGA